MTYLLDIFLQRLPAPFLRLPIISHKRMGQGLGFSTSQGLKDYLVLSLQEGVFKAMKISSVWFPSPSQLVSPMQLHHGVLDAQTKAT